MYSHTHVNGHQGTRLGVAWKQVAEQTGMSCQSRINDVHFRGSLGLGKALYFLNKHLEFQKDPLILSSPDG